MYSTHPIETLTTVSLSICIFLDDRMMYRTNCLTLLAHVHSGIIMQCLLWSHLIYCTWVLIQPQFEGAVGEGDVGRGGREGECQREGEGESAGLPGVGEGVEGA